MKIVVDSNVIFSALIRDSTTRRQILECDNMLLFPVYIFEELEKHKDELMSKSRMEKEDFDALLHLLLSKMIIVPTTSLKPHKEEAVSIIRNIDMDDAVFIACALAYPGSIIWSDDKKLKLQQRIRVFNSSEIKEVLS
ncbi:PIN domain-containing protein [Candidatus Woesearchaeota archaeon]|nr:MAG: hypothetical protein QS99_C0012G0002 [archaeon GW2011_AR4]MBS3130677.1 PIN domain-containing protein [Candidatus Woesearchaeota archaeon]HIH37705.1 PIN domain-containing protein [Candidatus Woesearchaeota archaeon]HIH48620.1 PIN domain-containing protein [Candidatus Woesearchaeota archaeon]HIJ03707.1 PIN domain-containing protein [Candidatus Woesearchaeota archaeon]